MLKRHMILTGVLVGLSMMLWGCAGNVPEAKRIDILDAHLSKSVETAKQRGVPAWLEIDVEKFEGKVVALPKRDEITMPMNEQLIVELYSR